MSRRQLEYCWKASRLIPVSSESSGTIITHLLSKFKEIDGNDQATHIELPKHFLKGSVTCKFCLSVWRERQYRVRIEPKKQLSRNERRIILRYQSNPGQLAKDQRKFAEKLMKNSNNLVLTCAVCSKKATVPIPPIKQPTPPPPPITVTEPPKPKKKRKKPSKDLHCGLKMSLVTPKQRKNASNHQISTELTSTDVSTVASTNQVGLVLKHESEPQNPIIKNVPKINHSKTIVNPQQQQSHKKLDTRSKIQSQNVNIKVQTQNKTSNLMKLNNKQPANKNKKSNKLNKDKLKAMLSQGPKSSSLQDFLRSLP